MKNISQLGLFFPIYGKVKKVPNQQPVDIEKPTGHSAENRCDETS
jgi:hypothetical protein